MSKRERLIAGANATGCVAAEVTRLNRAWSKPHQLAPPHASGRLSIALALVSIFLFAAAPCLHAQYNIGLYKNGQLIDTFGPVGPATNAAAKALSAKVGGTAIPQTAAGPAIPADIQARNQVFADSANLGLQIRDALRQMQNPAINPQAAQPSQAPQLANLLQQLIAKQTEVRAAYDAIARHLVELKLPPEILKRHFDAVAANEAGFAAFTEAVNLVLSGKAGALEAALALLDQIKLRNEPDLTRTSPTHQAMPILKAPELSLQEADVARTGQLKAAFTPPAAGSGKASPKFSPPTSDDLAETPDVQLTTEIRAKAASLGNSPYAIYNFVKNQVVFQPYLGSRKGALNTLRQLAGNDTDQTSLLIALLRAANIPCRYVRGTVEMTPNQVTSWLGVDDLSTAASILATAGLNAAFYGGNVRCTHVWVEAYVPYSNYRGVPNDGTGKTWIPLDPAFKGTAVVPGEDLLAAAGINVWDFLKRYVANPALTNYSPIGFLEQTLQSWLNTNRPGTHVADFERQVGTATEDLGLLPASMPLQVLSATSPFPTLSDTNRFKVRFLLYSGGTTFIDYTTNVSQLAGHRVTISYVGATTNDQATIDAHGGIYFTPPYLVNVKPVLSIDDVPVSFSASSVGMGRTHSSDVYFTQPAGGQNVQPVIYNDITAGVSQAIGFDTFMDLYDPLVNGSAGASSNFFHVTLCTLATDYLGLVEQGMDNGHRLMRMVSIQDVSEAIVEGSVSVTTDLLGTPQTFAWAGFSVDADRRIIGPFAVNGDSNKTVPYMLLTGSEGSSMEHRIFESTFATPAVSTIRTFHVSGSQGIPLCYITNSITSACPGFSHSASVLYAVNTALSRGHIVIIPQRDITYGHWAGTGYIDLDPGTGAAGYIIAGGTSGTVSASGGAIVDWFWPLPPPCLTWPWNVTYEFLDPSANSPDPSAVFCADEDPITFKARVTATSCLIGSPSYETTRTGFRSKKWITENYGGGDYTLVMDSIFGRRVECKITIVRPNLVFQALPESAWFGPDEESPGGFVGISKTDLEPLEIDPGVGSLTTGNLYLEVVGGSSKAKLWLNDDATGPVPILWSVGSVPNKVYVQGAGASSSEGDITLRLSYDGFAVGTCADQKYLSDEVKLTVVSVRLQTVEFSGSGNYHAIKKDDGTDYTPPHFQRTTTLLDQDADDPSDVKLPVCYTRNTTMNVREVEWLVEPASFSRDIYVGGKAPEGMEFPPTEADISGGTLTISDVECANALDNKVRFFNSMPIAWTYTIGSGTKHYSAGTSRNQVYVTWGDPLTTVYHTLLHVGCKNADKKDLEGDIISKVWDDFRDCEVYKANATAPLTYYNNGANPYTTPADLPGLLKYGDGRCGTFQALFIETLLCQGITSLQPLNIFENVSFESQAISAYTLLYGHAPSADNYEARDVFFVKHWDLTSANRWSAVDQPGVTGQGNSNPLSVFADHALVEIGTKVYDPSYGAGPFNSLQDWEDASIDGYGVQFIKDPLGLSVDFKFWIGKQDTKGVLEVTQ